MKISYSKVELYSQCPKKYYYKYIEKLEIDKTFSSLLFGSAVDKSLNYILTRTKHHHKVYSETALNIFLKNMKKWHSQNELVFFKNEAPYDIENYSKEEAQVAVWNHLCVIGAAMLVAYKKEILPKFKRIISVQTRKCVPNVEGDELILITDFVAQLHDDRIVVFDNKTTSDIKKNYSKSAVSKSQQLAIYSEFEETKLAGYIALSKKLKEGNIDWTMIIDEVPEEQIEKAFDKIDSALRSIKKEEFPLNTKSCFSFGRKCEYYNACKFNNFEGIIKKEK